MFCGTWLQRFPACTLTSRGLQRRTFLNSLLLYPIPFVLFRMFIIHLKAQEVEIGNYCQILARFMKASYKSVEIKVKSKHILYLFTLADICIPFNNRNIVCSTFFFALLLMFCLLLFVWQDNMRAILPILYEACTTPQKVYLCYSERDLSMGDDRNFCKKEVFGWCWCAVSESFRPSQL